MPIITKKINEKLLSVRINANQQESFSDLLEKVKDIPGRKYNPTLKVWNVPNNSISLKLLKNINSDIENKIIKEFKNSNDWKKVKLPESAPDYLRPYQKDCLKFLIYSNGRALIGDPMGAGKTVESLSWIATFGKKTIPMLTITRATIKRQWYKAYKQFVSGNDIDLLYGQKPELLGNNMNYIINWDILHYWEEELLKVGFKTIIADECQFAGNMRTKRTKAFVKLSKKAEYILPLSGTPIRSRPAQFYPVLSVLLPETFNNEWRFLQKYCNPKHNGFGWTYNGASNIEQLHEIVNQIMIRRDKKEILPDLPDKEIITVPIEIEHTQEYFEALQRFKESAGLKADEEFNNLKVEAFSMKSDLVCSWIVDFIQSDEKIVVYTYHRKVIEYISNRFRKESVHIYGGVSGKQREEAIEKFINDPECKIMFAQILSVGVGVDGLQNVCSNCAFVEFADNSTDHDQAEDRLHRSGQKDSVNCYYLIAEKTIEEDLINILDEKRKIIDAVVDGVAPEESLSLMQLLKERI